MYGVPNSTALYAAILRQVLLTVGNNEENLVEKERKQHVATEMDAVGENEINLPNIRFVENSIMKV